MIILKFILYGIIFLLSTYIGILISKQYSNRVNELQSLRQALNIMKTKIRFSNENLHNIFDEIANFTDGNISNLFNNINKKLEISSAKFAWEYSIDNTNLYINKEDKTALKTLGKLLGRTDIDGQISEIELTESFIDTQILQAQKQKEKNGKLYKSLGMITGIGIIIIFL